MDNNNIYDWDSTIAKESEFTILPEGDYEFSIEKFERGNHEGSENLPPCKKAIVTFKIYGENNTTTVIENYYLCEKMEWQLSALFLSVGLKKHGEPLRMDWNALVGKRGKCRIYIHTYNEREYNRIKKLYAYDENVTTVTPKSQPAQGWQSGNF